MQSIKWTEYTADGPSVWRANGDQLEVKQRRDKLHELTVKGSPFLGKNGQPFLFFSHQDAMHLGELIYQGVSVAPAPKNVAADMTEDYALTQFAEASESRGVDWHKWAWLLEHRWPEKYAGKNLKGEAMRRACNVMLDAAHKTLGDEQFKALCEAIQAEGHKVDGAFDRFFEKGKGGSGG